MKRFRSFAFALFVVFVAAPAFVAVAQDNFDTVHQTGGKPDVRGTVTGSTANEVQVKQNQNTKTIPVNEVDYVIFADSPPQMRTARQDIAKGDLKNAQDRLRPVTLQDLNRDIVKQEYEFMQAMLAAKLAESEQEQREAGRRLKAFVDTNKNNFNYYAANELLGDILVAIGNHANSVAYYNELAKAPWPDYKMRADNALGRALLGSNQPKDALARFDEALRLGGSAGTKTEVLMATLGKAECFAQMDRVPEALKIAEDVLAKANPEEVELHARTYNALGNLYLKAKRKRDALLAFLHVDLLYASIPDAHAEALWNLAALWKDVGKPDRAVQAQEALRARYPGSRWAKKQAG